MNVATEERSSRRKPKSLGWLWVCLFVAGTRWKRALILAALASIFIWRGVIPGWRSLNADFPNYYLIARLYRQGDSLSRVYEWTWFQRQKDHAGMGKRIVSSIPLTLLSTLPVYPLSNLSPLRAKRYWLIFNLLLLCLTGVLLRQITSLDAIPVAILLLLAMEPLDQHFINGQFHILVLFLLTISLWFYLRGCSFSSGLVLAAAAAVKLYPVLFVFYFLRKKQWRAVFGLLAGALALVGLSVWLFGLEANQTFVEHILPRVSRGENIDPYTLGWGSITALLHRLFIFEPELNPHPVAHLPTLYAALQALAQSLLLVPMLWLLSPSRVAAAREKLEYGSYVVLLLLLSTAPASYHYCVLMLTAVLAADYLISCRKSSLAGAFVVLYALACFPFQEVLNRFSKQRIASVPCLRLFLTIALFMVLLQLLSRLAGQTWTERLKSRSRLAFLWLFVTLFASGMISNIHSLNGEFDNYASRLTTKPGSLMEAEPAISKGFTAFTLLAPHVFGTGVLSRDGTFRTVLDHDAFHPAFNPKSGDLWLEVAGKTSAIVSLRRNASADFSPIPITEVEDGEQPVISPDGGWLAFIREDKGRGSLWIKNLWDYSHASPPSQLVSLAYDVMESAFDPTRPRVIIAAQPDGRAGLFAVDLRSGEITQFAGKEEARYPALSPDGQILAYCKLEKGNWHLWLKRVDSGAEQQLTGGACNSISPAWLPGSKDIVYATDCGRGIGLTAPAKIRVMR